MKSEDIKALKIFAEEKNVFLELAGKGESQHLIPIKQSRFGRFWMAIRVLFNSCCARLDNVARYLLNEIKNEKNADSLPGFEKFKGKIEHYNENHSNKLLSEYSALENEIIRIKGLCGLPQNQTQNLATPNTLVLSTNFPSNSQNQANQVNPNPQINPQNTAQQYNFVFPIPQSQLNQMANTGNLQNQLQSLQASFPPIVFSNQPSQPVANNQPSQPLVSVPPAFPSPPQPNAPQINRAPPPGFIQNDADINECDLLREQFYEKLGTIDQKMLIGDSGVNPIGQYIIHRPNGNVLLATRGLADPPSHHPNTTGIGLELVMECAKSDISNDPNDFKKKLGESFLFQTLYEVSGNGLQFGYKLRQLLDIHGLVSMELNNVDAPPEYVDPNTNRTCALIGVISPSIPYMLDMPLNKKVMIATVRLLTHEECLLVRKFGTPGRRALADLFERDRSFHVSTIKPQPTPSITISSSLPNQTPITIPAGGLKQYLQANPVPNLVMNMIPYVAVPPSAQNQPQPPVVAQNQPPAAPVQSPAPNQPAPQPVPAPNQPAPQPVAVQNPSNQSLSVPAPVIPAAQS